MMKNSQLYLILAFMCFAPELAQMQAGFEAFIALGFMAGIYSLTEKP